MACISSIRSIQLNIVINSQAHDNISNDDKGRSDKYICFDMTLSFQLINDNFHHFVLQYVLFGLKHYISIF